MEQWVKELNESMLPSSSMKIGKIVKHPDGRDVYIEDGQYWGTYGLSNFWYWREVFPDGAMGEKEHGYGW